MSISDEEKEFGGSVILEMLKETGTVALYNDDEVYCFMCMFANHSHRASSFWSLDEDDIAKSEKVYVCDECGKTI